MMTDNLIYVYPKECQQYINVIVNYLITCYREIVLAELRCTGNEVRFVNTGSSGNMINLEIDS